MKYNGGNTIARHMILDAIVVRLATSPKMLSSEVITESEHLIHSIRKNVPKQMRSEEPSNKRCVKYFHPKIALNINLARLSNRLLTHPTDLSLPFLNNCNRILGIESFHSEMHWFLRALLLSDLNVDDDLWCKVVNSILTSVKTANNHLSTDAIYFVLYLLAQETGGKRQLVLLRGLAQFATTKVRSHSKKLLEILESKIFSFL